MKTLVPVKILEQKDNEQLYIEFREDLKLFSDYKLHIEFEGKLDKSLSGFYRSTYLDPLTNTNRFITTHTIYTTYIYIIINSIYIYIVGYIIYLYIIYYDIIIRTCICVHY